MSVSHLIRAFGSHQRVQSTPSIQKNQAHRPIKNLETITVSRFFDVYQITA